MTYAYIVDNTAGDSNHDNTLIFQLIYKIKLCEDYIYADCPGQRQEIVKLLNKLQPGDTVICRSIQDVALSTSQLLVTLIWLNQNKIEFVSVLEQEYQYSDTLYFLHTADNFYKERNRIEGYERAKLEGKIGRPQNSSVPEAIELYEQGKFTVDQITKITGVPSATLYRHLLKSN